MINDFLKSFTGIPIAADSDYKMDSIILCPINTNLIYNVRLLKSEIPFVSDSMYSEDDIISLFDKSLNKAIQNIIFYSCEYIYNYKGKSFKFSLYFEELKLYQKKNVFFYNVQTKDNKLYEGIVEYITSAGSEGRTLNDVSYRFFRNHRSKQSQMISRLEESGKFLITKQAGSYKRPRTVFIALESVNDCTQS
jgi:hypothetical protein